MKKRTDKHLAEGEVTGHAHVAAADDAVVYGEGDVRLLDAPSGTTVTHEEHKHGVLPPGQKEIDWRQFAYDAMTLCNKLRVPFIFKKDLRAYCDFEIVGECQSDPRRVEREGTPIDEAAQRFHPGESPHVTDALCAAADAFGGDYDEETDKSHVER